MTVAEYLTDQWLPAVEPPNTRESTWVEYARLTRLHVAPRIGAVGLQDLNPSHLNRIGQATICMALAAADLGIGSGHAAVGDQDLARELLDLPTDRELAYLLALGYPADRPLDPIDNPDRRPFDDVVHRDRW